MLGTRVPARTRGRLLAPRHHAVLQLGAQVRLLVSADANILKNSYLKKYSRRTKIFERQPGPLIIRSASGHAAAGDR